MGYYQGCAARRFSGSISAMQVKRKRKEKTMPLFELSNLLFSLAFGAAIASIVYITLKQQPPIKRK